MGLQQEIISEGTYIQFTVGSWQLCEICVI